MAVWGPRPGRNA
uniref:Uncharacterized protein n=1 Tax=Arundo donax TaxID=35708 RepID=A0A0A9FIR5_ARUDO